MLETQTLSNNFQPLNKDHLASAFAHIEERWQELTVQETLDNGTRVGLPFPYIIPSAKNGTNFSFQEMYYWDSYFIAKGLITNGHNDLAEGMLENLIFMYRKFHIIPNASRTYFTGRSQPPFLTTYIFDIYEAQQKDLNWLRERMEVAEKEYRSVWTGESHPNWRNVHQGLSRYYDINVLDHLAEAESGWDMTTRFQGKCLSHIPIDLNCLLYKYEMDFSKTADLLGDADTASIWRNKAALRAEKVTELLWDDEVGFFFDLDYITLQKSKVWSLASYYALWSGLATNDQARRLSQSLHHFMHKGGLSATKSPGEYDSDMPAQWSYPNGWAPLHHITIAGLANYGYSTEAEVVTRAWLGNNLDHYTRNGVFREAYNVIDPTLPPKPGLYPPQLGFGWTNAVFVDLAKKFLSKEELQLV